jgi:6-phosphofructokinase 1
MSIKTIGLLTSGGDSPGMNACIRAVVRTAISKGIAIKGIKYGYQGLIDNNIVDLVSKDVSNIIQRGGTILKTSRSKDFPTQEGMQKALNNLKKAGIDAVIAIGGDGTFRGANEFSAFSGIPFIGIPGTIDNDLAGTDYTIGFDTAVNTALDAIDKIRDTADSHDRLFFIEVMGRDAGYIALYSGLAGGAEALVIPETPTDINQLIDTLRCGWAREKSSKIVVVAEGDDAGGANDIAIKVKEQFSEIDTRVSILGHMQRGGKPTTIDRLNATRMGYAAVNALLAGRQNVMVGIVNNRVLFTPLANAVKLQPEIDAELLEMVRVLSA